MKINFIIILLLIILQLIFPSKINAQSSIYFYDDFIGSELNSHKWLYDYNGGDIELSNSIVNLSSPIYNNFPYVRSKYNLFPTTGSFTLEFRAAFPQITPWGVGLLFCSTAVNNMIPRTDPINSRIFTYHADLSKNTFWFRFLLDYYINTPEVQLYAQKNNNFHTITVTYNHLDMQYGYYIDSHLIYNNSSSIRPTFLFFGSPYFQQSVPESTPWTFISLDYIKILEGLYPPDMVTPTPTPSQDEGEVVVLVPGHGASFDLLGLLDKMHQGEWNKMPYFYNKVYGPIVESLKNAGYIKDNNNFYEFTYNWTRPTEEITSELDNKIENIKLNYPNKKINIIAHSFGGLISRNWLKNHLNKLNYINKLITVGSPHKGVVDAYGAWSGGEVWRDDPLQKFAFEILIYLFKHKYISNAETVRDIAPSTRDLLPIFDYLKWHKGNIINYNTQTITTKNSFLENLNTNTIPSYSNKINIYRGNNFSTMEYLEVKEPSKHDLALKQWEDGVPIHKEYSNNGDGSVLTNSSNITGIPFNEDNLNHGDLIKTQQGISKIFDLLGISRSNISTNIEISDNQNYLAFFTNPPTCFNITDGSGNIIGCDENQQLITNNSIPDAESDDAGSLIVLGDPSDENYSLVIPRNPHKTDLIKVEMKNQKVDFKKYTVFPNGNNKFYFVKSNSTYQIPRNLEILNINNKYDDLYNTLITDSSYENLKLIIKDKLFEQKESLVKINQYLDLNWDKKAGDEILKSEEEIYKIIKLINKDGGVEQEKYFLLKQELLDLISDLTDVYLTLNILIDPQKTQMDLLTFNNNINIIQNDFEQRDDFLKLKVIAWDLQYATNLLQLANLHNTINDFQSVFVYTYMGQQMINEINLK